MTRVSHGSKGCGLLRASLQSLRRLAWFRVVPVSPLVRIAVAIVVVDALEGGARLATLPTRRGKITADLPPPTFGTSDGWPSALVGWAGIHSTKA